MSENYKEYCMKFSNEELKKNMVEYLIKKSWDEKMIRFLSEDGDEIEIDSSKEIGTIIWDKRRNKIFDKKIQHHVI